MVASLPGQAFLDPVGGRRDLRGTGQVERADRFEARQVKFAQTFGIRLLADGGQVVKSAGGEVQRRRQADSRGAAGDQNRFAGGLGGRGGGGTIHRISLFGRPPFNAA
jgi:hypothetical protein